MSQARSYPTRAELDSLVSHMRKAGIGYAEAVHEFRKQFVLTALREVDWNETGAARALRIHRNALARTLRELNIDLQGLRKESCPSLVEIPKPEKIGP